MKAMLMGLVAGFGLPAAAGEASAATRAVNGVRYEVQVKWVGWVGHIGNDVDYSYWTTLRGKDLTLAEAEALFEVMAIAVDEGLLGEFLGGGFTPRRFPVDVRLVQIVEHESGLLPPVMAVLDSTE